jgi:NADH:ubiquinone oxidoreductase subunit 6 (subunit J)
VAGYLIASTTALVAFALGASGAGRPRVVLFIGAVLAVGWVVSVAVARARDIEVGREVLPLWLFAGLVGLLYVIWCGGLWLGVRLRRGRSR